MAQSAVKKDNWSTEEYQNAAGFVPQLATKVVQWLDAKPTDRILDVGCGDGVLTGKIAKTLNSGSIHGTDFSSAMIDAARTSYSAPNCTYSVQDSTKILEDKTLEPASYDKVFSNAALHWILANPSTRVSVFQGIHRALKENGTLTFEMGGMGNVSEMRAAILSSVARRIGIVKAREADPWFFPDQEWMKVTLEKCGFVVEKSELEFRPTPVQTGEGGGVGGWVRLMGKTFFDAVGEQGSKERKESEDEAVEVLETVCAKPNGECQLGYVRLRILARKVGA